MKSIKIDNWSFFKDTVITKKKLGLQYTENNLNYFIFAGEAGIFFWEITLEKTSEDALDFETNYKTDANSPLEFRSEEGLIKFASAKFVDTLSFFPTGAADQLELSTATLGFIKYHFETLYTLAGVHAFWENASFGDFISLSVGVYTTPNDENSFIEIAQFADQYKILGTHSIQFDVPTVKTVPPTVNLGFGDLDVYIRVVVGHTTNTTAKYIVNLIGWK